jgi:hypothetical protein
MRIHPIARGALGAATALCLFSGCTLPRQGTPVFVDFRAGNFWSGKGVLVDVSDDRTRCRVAVRDRALLVRKMWVDCPRVHPRRD